MPCALARVLAAGAAAAAAAAASPPPRRGMTLLGNVTARPSQQQLQWHAQEVGAMVTWNLQSACVLRASGNASKQECQADTPTGQALFLPSADAVRAWDPSAFDAAALLTACTAFGARYVVFVADHMAGMALWPSAAPGALTIANTSYKGGRGDIVGEVAAAAGAAGVKLGFFYSTHYNYAQGVNNYVVGWPRAYGGAPLTQAQYEDLVLVQLQELAGYAAAASSGGGAGSEGLWELWLDGGFNASATPRLGPWLRANLPGALCHSCVGATEAGPPGLDGRGLRWMGNEMGEMPLPSWGAAAAAAPPFNGDPTAPLYLPPSSDTVLRQHFWFWQPALAGGAFLRPPCELLNVYLTTVGRASNLVLNVAPTDTGAILPQDAAAYAALGAGVACVYSVPLGAGANLTLDAGGAVVLALPAPVPARPGPCADGGAPGSCGVWRLTAVVGEEMAVGGQRLGEWSLEGCVTPAAAAAAAGGAAAAAAAGDCSAGTWTPLLNASWPAAATTAVGHKRIVAAGAALPSGAGALALTAVRFLALSAYAWAGGAPPAANPPYVLTTLALYDRAPAAIGGCLPQGGCALVDY